MHPPVYFSYKDAKHIVEKGHPLQQTVLKKLMFAGRNMELDCFHSL